MRQSNSAKANILVVDDTRANLRLLTGLLSKQGYKVRPIPTGRMALSSAKAKPPDLILLDIMMPGMDGYQVCEQLKADETTRHIPVIFLSALNDALDKVKAFSVGGVDYVAKPFQVEEVIARVETHLALRRLQQQVERKNQSLQETLAELKATQHELVQSEKMAALGQLVAGIAHEINTPLGAIQASIGNIDKALASSIEQLPQLFQQLSLARQADFFALCQQANHELLTSRQARKVRRGLRRQLETRDIKDADLIAESLVNMGIYEEIEHFIPLLEEENSIFIVQAAYDLYTQQSNSKNIKIAVERASKVLFALKSYTHQNPSGQMSKASIPDTIEIVLTIYHNLLKQGIELIREYDEVPQILCYPDELNQVWTNLIHNAIQAMHNKGQLKITVFEENDYIAIQLTDSGKGIPPDIKKRIFDAFFTTKPMGEGSGLGLHIVRKIIDKHEGKIEVESEPGNTTFTVLLPIRF